MTVKIEVHGYSLLI